jgi:hypothetical protein
MLVVAAALLFSGVAVASEAAASLSATVDRPRISTQLGRSFEFRSTISNSGPRAARGLVAHLSVLSLRDDPYVDPEDWSPQRVVFLDAIPAGGSRILRWRMTAVNAGTFGIYVTVLSRDAAGGSARPAPNTPTVALRVTQRRTLNSGGILPLVIAIPRCSALSRSRCGCADAIDRGSEGCRLSPSGMALTVKPVLRASRRDRARRHGAGGRLRLKRGRRAGRTATDSRAVADGGVGGRGRHRSGRRQARSHQEGSGAQGSG